MSRIPVTSPPSFAPYRRRSSTSATIFPSSSRKKRFCTNFVAANRMELHLSEQRSRVFCVPFLLSRLSMTTVASSLLTVYPLRNAMLDHPGTRIVTIVFFNVRWFFVSLPVALLSTNLFSMKFIIDRINQDCYRYFSRYKRNWELNFLPQTGIVKILYGREIVCREAGVFETVLWALSWGLLRLETIPSRQFIIIAQQY